MQSRAASVDLRARRRRARDAASSSASARDARDPLGLACRAWRGRRRPSSAGSRSSSGALRSWSQKNLASDSRARSTRSLPSTIVLPPSRATLLATTTKRLASAPSVLVVREVALVRPHGDDQHLGRHVHELRVDGAEQRHRPFDQAGDLVEQAVVGLERDLRLGAELLGAVEHDLLALGRIEHHVRRLELGRVVGEVRDLDRRPC